MEVCVRQTLNVKGKSMKSGIKPYLCDYARAIVGRKAKASLSLLIIATSQYEAVTSFSFYLKPLFTRAIIHSSANDAKSRSQIDY